MITKQYYTKLEIIYTIHEILLLNKQLAIYRKFNDIPQNLTAIVMQQWNVIFSGDEEFLILACDGLWDCVPFDNAVQLVCQCVRDGERDNAAYKLVELAKEKKSMDNISVLVVYLDFNRPFSFSSAQEEKDILMAAENHSEESDIQTTVHLENIINGVVSEEKSTTLEKQISVDHNKNEKEKKEEESQ